MIASQSCEEIEEQGSIGIVLSNKPPRILSPPTIPTDLQDAVVHATILALARRSLGPVPSLDVLNCIIEPLGAVLTVDTPFDVWSAIEARRNAFCDVINAITGAITRSPAGLVIEDFEEQGTGAGFDPIAGPYRNFCRCAPVNCFDPPVVDNVDDEQGQVGGGCCIFGVPISMMIAPLSDTIAAFKRLECPHATPVAAGVVGPAISEDAGIIPAFFVPTDPTRPDRIYPGVLAAECIVRSILPDTMSYTLRRCLEPINVRSCP